MAQPANLPWSNAAIAPPATGGAMQAMVDAVIRRLDVAGIPYCLLRNRDRIPEGLLHWTDLDILLPGGLDARTLVRLMADLHPAQVVAARPGLSVFSFPVGSLFLRVDFCSGDFDWRGAPFVYADDILADRWNDDGIMVASELHQAYVTWISKLIWSGFFSSRYAEVICHAAREYPVALHHLLQRPFGSQLASQLLEIAREDRLPESEQLVPALRRELWRRAIRRQPLAIARSAARQATSRIGSVLDPTGIVVTMAGPATRAANDACLRLTHLPARRLPCGRVDHLTANQPVFRILPETINRRLSTWRWVRPRLVRGRLVLDNRPWAREGLDAATRLQRAARPRARQADLVLWFDTAPVLVPRVDGPGPRIRLIDTARGPEAVITQVEQAIIATYAERTARRFPEVAP